MPRNDNRRRPIVNFSSYSNYIPTIGTAFRILLFLGITSVPRNYCGLITETPATNNDVNVL